MLMNIGKKHTYAHKSNYVSNYVRYVWTVLKSLRNLIMLLKLRLVLLYLYTKLCRYAEEEEKHKILNEWMNG